MPSPMLRLNRRMLLAATGAVGLTAVAVPALAQASAAPKPMDWVRPPAILMADISPDGLRNLALTEENGQKSLVTFNTSTGKAGRIDIGDVAVVNAQWVGNNHVAVTTLIPARRLRSDAGLNSLMLGNIYNVDNPNRITVFDAIANFQPGVVMEDLVPIQRNGKWMVAASSAYGPDKDFTYLYALDPDTGKGELLDRGSGDNQGWLVAPDGTPVARSGYYFHDHQWSMEHYDGNGWKESYRTDVAGTQPVVYGLGRDGSSVVVNIKEGVTDAIGNYYEIGRDGSKSAPLADDPTAQSPYFHPRTLKFTGFTRAVDGWFRYEMFDDAMSALAAKAQSAVPGYRMRLDGVAEDSNTALVYSQGEDDAGTWYHINFAKGQPTEVGMAYPDIDPAFIAQTQLLTYPAADGTTIAAYLTLPVGKPATGLPLVVVPHGGMFGRSSIGIDWMAQSLAAAGYAVLKPDYRGSTGHGVDFVNAGYGEWAGKRLTDLSDGVAKLAAEGTVDATRVSILGENRGGHLALLGVSRQDGVYRSAASIGGYADITTEMGMFGDTAQPFYKFMAAYYGGDFDAISPIKYASKVSVPVFLAHSQDDPGVPYQQSSKMAAALKSAGNDVTFVTTKATNNWTLLTTWRQEVMEPLLAFLARTNPA